MLARAPSCTGLLLGGAVGAVAAVFGALVAGNPLQAASLPAAIALLFLLVLDRAKLLLAILVCRSAGDLLFEATRFSLFGYPIGVGGVINAVVILIVALLVAEKPHVVPRKAIAAWAGLLAAVAVGVAMSPVKGDALRTALALLSYFAVFTGAFYVVRSPGDFRFCVRLVIWSSLVPALYALFELATGGARGAEGLRIRSTFPHPNVFAFYLVLVISLALYTLKTEGKRLSQGARLALNAYMIALLGLLLLTQTRSAWIACFAIFLIYGIACERRYLVYTIAAPFAALLVPSVQDRLLELATGNEYVQYARLNSFAWRRLIWESGLAWMRADHYALGYGLESFRHYSLTFFSLAAQSGIGFGAHSVYVQLFFELGVFGLVAYLWLFARLLAWLKPLLRTDRLAAIVVGSLTVAYLIVSAADNMLSYLSFNWYFWFLGGAAAAAATIGGARSGPADAPGRSRATGMPERATAA